MQRNWVSNDRGGGYQVSVVRGQISSMLRESPGGCLTGRVHSCFRTGMNLMLGDSLVYLDDGRHGLCCFGMAVGAEDMKGILDCCHVGALAVYRGGCLRIYGQGGVVRLAVSEFEPVDLRIPAGGAMGADMSAQERQEGEAAGRTRCFRLLQESHAGEPVGRVRCFQSSRESHAGEPVGRARCFQLLRERAEAYRLGIEKDARFLACAVALAEAEDAYEHTRSRKIGAGGDCAGEPLPGGNGEPLSTAVQFFLGRGQGLTPAGDDLLTGYLAVLQCFGQADRMISLLQKELDSASTTDVSRAYLQAAARGYANERFVRLLRLYLDGKAGQFQEVLGQMEQIGHTSGCDTLYGAYLGLKNMKEDIQL